MGMNPDTSATLGEPDFPPKNGIIIKQGHLFVQETRKILFVKWKVWRKRWISLRYLSNSATPVLQIDSRNPVLSSHLLLNLSQESSVEMIDSSGPQDLATAKALQLSLDPLSEPLIFKHPSQIEMTDWMAAFRLTVALGETGSICSDTDSSTWNESQAATSPVSSNSPNNLFTPDVHTAYTIKIKACTVADKVSGLVVDQEYQLNVSPLGVMLCVRTGPSTDLQTFHWPLHHIKKVYQPSALGDESATVEDLCVELSKHSITGECAVLLQTAKAADLCQQLRLLIMAPSNLKRVLAEDQEKVSIRSKGSRRRTASERPKKRPLSLIGPRARLSTDQASPVHGRAPRLQSRENSVRSMSGLRSFPHMDSRDSEYSSTEGVSSHSSLTKIAVPE